jgi:hypothetical protein
MGTGGVIMETEIKETPRATLAARSYNAALRLEVFTHYCGGETPSCQCPGCTTTYIEFLQLDHINGDGAKHRKENNLGTGGPRLWRWVRAQRYPEGFQVLCRNCNGAKFTRAACPLSGQQHR